MLDIKTFKKHDIFRKSFPNAETPIRNKFVEFFPVRNCIYNYSLNVTKYNLCTYIYVKVYYKYVNCYNNCKYFLGWVIYALDIALKLVKLA